MLVKLCLEMSQKCNFPIWTLLYTSDGSLPASRCRFSIFKSVLFQIGLVFGISISIYCNICSVFDLLSNHLVGVVLQFTNDMPYFHDNVLALKFIDMTT